MSAQKDKAAGKRTGRPSKYKEEYADLAYKFCLLGATNKELANLFDVAGSTIDKWLAEIEPFSGAVKSGRAEADAIVADRLFKRATGYEHEAVKIVADAKTGAEHIVPYIERYAPDTTAAIFWLKNRRPDLWRDRQELTGSNGNDLFTGITVNLVKSDNGKA